MSQKPMAGVCVFVASKTKAKLRMKLASFQAFLSQAGGHFAHTIPRLRSSSEHPITHVVHGVLHMDLRLYLWI